MSFLNRLKESASKVVTAVTEVMADEETSAARLKICNNCEELNRRLRQCKICLCFVDGKTKFQNSKCPEGKW